MTEPAVLPGRGKRGLVVDDEQLIREIIVLDLEFSGFAATQASSGNEAVKLLSERAFDFVLSDIRMPNGDGISMLKALRARDLSTPVLFMSGFSDVPVWDVYALGAEALLGKPFDSDALMNALQRLGESRDERWNHWLKGSDKPAFNLDLKFPSSEAANGSIALGRGGMFVACCDPNLRRDYPIGFDIDLADFRIEGEGIVRWIRGSDVNGLPSGCGIEFTALTPQSRLDLLATIATAKPLSFIPAAPVGCKQG